MKKLFIFVLAALISAFFTIPVHAQYIEGVRIELEQIFGAYADFDSGTETITWSGGVDGWLLTDGGDFYIFSELPDFESSPVNATFTSMADTSSGGQASARFSSGVWDASIIANGETVAYLDGHILNYYNETETGPNTDKLDGRAIVIVDTATFDNNYWEPIIGEAINWDGVGEQAGIIADITLPYGTDILDYSEDYQSDNVIVTLYADESVIPEPATIVLLTIGGGLLSRKRR